MWSHTSNISGNNQVKMKRYSDNNKHVQELYPASEALRGLTVPPVLTRADTDNMRMDCA